MKYKVFVILGPRSTASNTQKLESLSVGCCDTPSDALQLVQEALHKKAIVNPKFVLLVPDSQLRARSE